MSVTWTEEQKKVIELRNRNILVSAAAGSGKTAVLVERILAMLTDSKRPVDIDRLLIVTFTKAAAAELKERIGRAVEERLGQEPDNAHLIKQLTLLHNAQITTIDSFCLHVIRNHFNAIELDPSFRVGDEGELKLLKADVLEKLLEDNYAKGREEFGAFVEAFASGKSDKPIEELILQLHTFAMSHPWPEEWLDGCLAAYELSSVEELKAAGFMERLMATLKQIAADVKKTGEELLLLAAEEDGPYMYEAALREDMAYFERLAGADDYEQFGRVLNSIVFASLSSKKDEAVSAKKREAAKALRNQEKEQLKKLKEQYFFQPPEEMVKDMIAARPAVRELIRLTKEFLTRYQEEKELKNLADFNDLEHFALKILWERDGEEPRPTLIARDYRKKYVEIMIDEYQDSNLIQELLLSGISRMDEGDNNMFMVGDVKQSIYRFRLSRPELFMEKYDTYSLTDAKKQRIDLHKNFRSRAEVLSGVNYLFYRLMGKQMGSIEYNEAAALYPGATFPAIEGADENGLHETELLLLETEGEGLGLKDADATRQELEARLAAKRIKELVGSHPVLDKATGQYRPARYQDVVILLRTLSGWADVFARVLMEEGIPAFTGSRTGYFSTLEVRTVLNFLRVLDNPRQDIPLTAVLKSPIGGLSDEELALIRCGYPKLPFHEACLAYAKDGEREELRAALGAFFGMVDECRDIVPYTSMHELLWYLLDRSGYGSYAAALPGGEQRRANLDMLVEKAMAFESTNYKGLFHFIRYIEKLHKFEVDYGEAGIVGENEDTVRIMSIHKSKGLEFPIVLLCGLGKAFNKQDMRSKVVIHPDLGMGIDYVDAKERIKAPLLLKKAIQKELDLENLGEELRILYVALTRAKEKLIMLGSTKRLAKQLEGAALMGGSSEGLLPFGTLSGASSYLDWILPALCGHPCMRPLYEQAGLTGPAAAVKKELPPIKAAWFLVEDLVKEEVVQQVERIAGEEELFALCEGEAQSSGIQAELEKRLAYRYPYDAETGLSSAVTVSELKKFSQTAGEEEPRALIEEPQVFPLIPRFIEEEKKAGPGERGTAFHKVLELLDFSMEPTLPAIRDFIGGLVKSGRLSPAAGELVNVPAIRAFLTSKLAKRMARALDAGQLKREQPFIIGVEARELGESLKSSELILLQGIIDVYFEEDGSLVLVDYKTDYVKDPAELTKTYRVQLDYYEKALVRLTGKQVKEKYIYSFALNEEIVIEKEDRR